MTRGGWVPRLAAAVAILAGLTLVAAIIAAHTFARADDGQRATDLVRAELTTRGLARHRADYELSKAGVEQFYDEALPTVAQWLSTTPQAIVAHYPAVAKLADPNVRGEDFAFADGIVTNLELHQHDFREADDIPVSWLPMTVGPWVGLGVGVALILAGMWALVRPSVVPLVLIGVIGLVLVAGPLLTRYPQKAHSAHRLLSTLNVTPAIAAHTRDILESARAALDETNQRLLPDVAAALHETPQQLEASFAARFPAMTRLQAQEREVYARYERRVEIREGGLKVIPGAKKFPLESATWWTVAIGGSALVASIVGLVSLRRRTGASSE